MIVLRPTVSRASSGLRMGLCAAKRCAASRETSTALPPTKAAWVRAAMLSNLPWPKPCSLSGGAIAA